MDVLPIALSMIFCALILRPALLLQNAALRQQILVFRRTVRPRVKPVDRIFWRMLRRLFGGWRSVCLFVQPATVTKWHREDLFRVFWRWLSRRRPGRRPLDREGVLLLRRIAAANPHWQPARLRGELLKLGYAACITTIKKYLGLLPFPPGGARSRGPSWWTFLKLHRECIAAMDFFVVYSLGFIPLYVFFVIDHGRRAILHTGVTQFPDLVWVRQQLREAFPSDHRIRFLVHDNDPVFRALAPFMISVLGIRARRTIPRRPWMNGIAERFVRTIRSELTDFLIPLNERHLARLVDEYVNYYNADRTHSTLDLDSPDGRPAQPGPGGRVVALPRVRGLHHVFRRLSAA